MDDDEEVNEMAAGEGCLEITHHQSPLAVVSAPPFRLHPSPPCNTSPFTCRSTTSNNNNSGGGRGGVASTPMKEARVNMKDIIDQEAWLPLTESRKGNAYYSAFHSLCSGIGPQALVLPLAFTALGWTWGIICLSLAFAWQLFTLWLLIQLHESQPAGTRYSRYLRLSMAAFGEKPGKLLTLFPTMYLSGGTCVILVIIGGGTMKIFFHTACGDACIVRPPTTTEWYLVFAVSAAVLAQLPNLNSIAGVSLVGSFTAVGYCTLIWAVSVARGRPAGVSYDPFQADFSLDHTCRVFNGLGIIALAFRGHNLVLEIQGTMHSTIKQPSRVPMWRGVKSAYLIIAACLFPIAIGGYWAYGNLMPANDGILNALYKYHGDDTSKTVLGLASLLVVISCLSSFQIYAMPVFDNLEFIFTNRINRPCPRWLRGGIRVFFGGLVLLIAVALPFLKSLGGLIGGVGLPVTFAYPCFMWIAIRRPKKHSGGWYLNWTLGCSGVALSILVVTGAVWSLVVQGMKFNFFKPQVAEMSY